MPIFGLTGGIGSGKSTVANAFRQYSIDVVDVDVIARQVVEPDQPALQKIIDHFGQDILLADGTLHRSRLRERIFSEPTEKDWLENLLHPIIRQRMQCLLNQSSSLYTLLESPLLFETDQHLLVSKVIVVDVDVSTQLQRAGARDGASPENIKRIIATQISREDRLNRADFIINNNGTIEQTLDQVKRVHESLKSQGKDW